MEIGIEEAGGGDVLEVLVGEEFVELFANHVHADVDHGGGVLGGGEHAHFEVINDGEEVFEEALIGVADGFFTLAGGAFAEVVHFRGGAEGGVFPLGGLGLELLPGVGFWGGRSFK